MNVQDLRPIPLTQKRREDSFKNKLSRVMYHRHLTWPKTWQLPKIFRFRAPSKPHWMCWPPWCAYSNRRPCSRWAWNQSIGRDITRTLYCIIVIGESPHFFGYVSLYSAAMRGTVVVMHSVRSGFCKSSNLHHKHGSRIVCVCVCVCVCV